MKCIPEFLTHSISNPKNLKTHSNIHGGHLSLQARLCTDQGGISLYFLTVLLVLLDSGLDASLGHFVLVFPGASNT